MSKILEILKILSAGAMIIAYMIIFYYGVKLLFLSIDALEKYLGM